MKNNVYSNQEKLQEKINIINAMMIAAKEGKAGEKAIKIYSKRLRKISK